MAVRLTDAERVRVAAPKRKGPPSMRGTGPFRSSSSTPPLVLRRKLAALSRCKHALHVCVPPLRHVAFRCDQRVLAHRVQHPVTERADVTRRLEVLGGTHCPPPSLHEPDCR